MSDGLDRARFFLERGRYSEAEQEIRGALSQEPDWAAAQSLLALCLLSQGQLRESIEEARAAIGLDPEFDFAHYVHAKALAYASQTDEALEAIREAIRLDPEDPNYIGFLAALQFDRKEWASTLETSERGLALDPENGTCAMVRAQALVRLGRLEEAEEAVEERLRIDPEDEEAHSARGLIALERRDPDAALASFREALRLDPNDAAARQGMIEALKGRYRLYRWFFGYSMWMSRMSAGKQWLFILGAYLGYQVLAGISKTRPDLGPYVWPLMGAYIAFVIISWTADPISNLLLGLNRFGRLILDDDQKRGARWTGMCLLAAASSLLVGAVWPAYPGAVAAIGFSAFMIPLIAALLLPPGPRLVMQAVCVGLMFLGLEGLVAATLAPGYSEETRNALAQIGFFGGLTYFVGVGLASFLGNILASERFEKLAFDPLLEPRAEQGRWRLLALAALALGMTAIIFALHLFQGNPKVVQTAIRLGIGAWLVRAAYAGRGWAPLAGAAWFGLLGGVGGLIFVGQDPTLANCAMLLPLVLVQAVFGAWLLLSPSLRRYITNSMLFT